MRTPFVCGIAISFVAAGALALRGNTAHAVRSEPEPLLGGCGVGCSAGDTTEALTAGRFRQLLSAIAAGNDRARAMDELLFHGEQTRRLLRAHGRGDLDEATVRTLERELSRTHALVEVRVIDTEGVVRVRLPRTRVAEAEARRKQ